MHSINQNRGKLYSCDVCGKEFARKEHLNRHSLIHSEVKPYTCDICVKSFTQKQHLKAHYFIHCEVKPHTCDTCGKSFTQKGYLKVHCLIHSEVRPHTCDICGKSFTQKGDLKVHSLIHSEIKPHTCDICGKSFARIGHLKKHSLIHNDEKPNSCQVCGKSFRWGKQLKKHALIHSEQKEPIPGVPNTSKFENNGLKDCQQENSHRKVISPNNQNGPQYQELGECFCIPNHLNECVDVPMKNFQLVQKQNLPSINDQVEGEGNKQECVVTESRNIDFLNGTLNVKEEDCFNEIVKEEHDVDYNECCK